MADRVKRKSMLGAGIIVWSLLTAVNAFAQNSFSRRNWTQVRKPASSCSDTLAAPVIRSLVLTTGVLVEPIKKGFDLSAQRIAIVWSVLTAMNAFAQTFIFPSKPAASS